MSIPLPYQRADAQVFIDECRSMCKDGIGAAFAIVDAAADGSWER